MIHYLVMKYILLIGMVAILVTLQTVNGQSFEPLRYKPEINEDQAIVCVKDVTDSEYRGQLYCKEYQADFDHPRTLQDIVQDLDLNPFEDTFEMGLID